MKNLSIIVVVTMLCKAGFASAPGGSDICGLGWEVTQKKSFLGTSTRTTTNFFVPPTFGMTTGTIGCDQHSIAKKDRKAIQYVAANYESVITEMAEGRGEYLQAFAQTMGCPSNMSGAFGSTVQKSYGSIVNTSSNAIGLVNNVKSQLKQNPSLALGCGII